jgi:hypothetical protein
VARSHGIALCLASMASAVTPHLRPWIYQRVNPGDLRPVPLRTYDQWVYGKASLPPSNDGFVWLVFVTVWTANRRALKLQEVSFSKHRVNARGVHTDKMRFEETNVSFKALDAYWSEHGLAATSASTSQEAAPSDPAVVDATHRFAQARYRWKPTAADLEALRTIVNSRARHVLIK